MIWYVTQLGEGLLWLLRWAFRLAVIVVASLLMAAAIVWTLVVCFCGAVLTLLLVPQSVLVLWLFMGVPTRESLSLLWLVTRETLAQAWGRPCDCQPGQCQQECEPPVYLGQ